MNFLFHTLHTFYSRSIGKKIIVALTGIALLLFLAGHLSGNLLVYLGPDAINSYAHGLRNYPLLLWSARIGLLLCFVVHIIATIHLTKQNRAARNSAYAYKATVRATLASRTMIYSGLLVLCFVIYHLMHYTLGIANEFRSSAAYYEIAHGVKRHNAYKMIIDGFRVIPVSLFYIFCVGLLCNHVRHGFSSVFQTLGWRSKKSWPTIVFIGNTYALALFIGYTSIPLSVMLGWLTY